MHATAGPVGRVGTDASTIRPSIERSRNRPVSSVARPFWASSLAVTSISSRPVSPGDVGVEVGDELLGQGQFLGVGPALGDPGDVSPGHPGGRPEGELRDVLGGLVAGQATQRLLDLGAGLELRDVADGQGLALGPGS